jgi:hypothetical protein
MVDNYFKKKLEGDKYAGYKKIGEKVGKRLEKAGDKVSSNKMSYNSSNPLKKILKTDRVGVHINRNKERINLMRATW